MKASVSTARAVAAALLDQVLHQRRPLDEALASSPALGRLEPRDRGFARLLVATALRRLGQIDDALGRLVERMPADAGALRLGAAQLLFLGTPAHAAVGETVAAAPPKLKGLTNAVLRRLAAEGPAILAEQDAARLNLPDWLWRSWTRAHGEPATRAIAAQLAEDPPLDLSVKGDPAAWAERLEARLLPTGTLRRALAPVETLPGFAEGAWWVQDAAAALPAKLLGPVGQVVDLCAAPGGKTLQLAAAGAAVTAVDRSAPRLERLRANLTRLGLAAEVVAADAIEWRPPAPVEAVLLDAPCSATGTARRHPDVPHLKSPTDLAKLVPLQDRLLRAAIEMLRPGGVMVYCVCSLEPEEGPARVAALLRQGGVTLDPIRPGELPDELVSDGQLRTTPANWAEAGGLDGFYAARLRRMA